MNLLTREQTEEIKEIRRLEALLGITIGLNGWMCEGADDDQLVFFNNVEGKMFYADYFGNIVYASCEVPIGVKKYAELEGKIAQICCMD